MTKTNSYWPHLSPKVALNKEHYSKNIKETLEQQSIFVVETGDNGFSIVNNIPCGQLDCRLNLNFFDCFDVEDLWLLQIVLNLIECPSCNLFRKEIESDKYQKKINRYGARFTPGKRIVFTKKERFEILKRDNYRCQLCGRNAQDNVKLHIDHKIPLAKGGTNRKDNLWVLCIDCNKGKWIRNL